MSLGALQNKPTMVNAQGVVSGNITFPKDVRAGSLLVVAGGIWRATAPTVTVTDTRSTPYTVRQSGTVASVSGLPRGYLASGIAPASGACVATVGGLSGSYINMSAIEVFGAAESPVDVEAVETTGTGTAPSISLTTLTADTVVLALLLAATVSATAIVMTQQAPSILLDEDEGSGVCPFSFCLQHKVAPGVVTFDWVLGTSREWRVIAAAFKPLAAGGGSVTTVTRLVEPFGIGR